MEEQKTVPAHMVYATFNAALLTVQELEAAYAAKDDEKVISRLRLLTLMFAPTLRIMEMTGFAPKPVEN